MKALVLLLPLLLTALPVAADVAVSKRDCDRLVKYRQSAGVEYQAGVDVHGRPVAPADIGGGHNIKTPEIVVIPIEVLLRDSFDIPANSVLWGGSAQVGTVIVEGDRVYYEGQLLGDPEAEALTALCNEYFPPQ